MPRTIRIPSAVWALVLLLLFGAVIGGVANSAEATPPTGNVCVDNGTKVDVTGSHKTIEVTAPDGKLISSYCVKAGSTGQGNGPVVVPVEPPRATVTISHPSGKDISHYTLDYVPVGSPTTTTDTPSSTSSTTSSSSSTTTTAPPTSTTSTTTTQPTTATASPTTTGHIKAPLTSKPRRTSTPVATTPATVTPAPAPVPDELALTGFNWALLIIAILLITAGIVAYRMRRRTR